MWRQFADLGDYERFVVDTSTYDPQATVDEVWTRLHNGATRLAE